MEEHDDYTVIPEAGDDFEYRVGRGWGTCVIVDVDEENGTAVIETAAGKQLNRSFAKLRLPADTDTEAA